MPRPSGFRFLNRDNDTPSQFWDSGLGDLVAGGRFFELFSRFFGLSVPTTSETASQQPAREQPAPETGPAIRFVRPPLDTAATVPADLGGGPDDTIVMTFGRGGTDTPGEEAVTVITGSNNVPEGGDNRLFTVQVDWPWQLQFGLVPITSDPASQMRREPIGWLERYLDQQAQLSPLSVEVGAEAFSDAAANPPWAWAGTALGSLELSGDFSAGFTLAAMPSDVDRITLQAGNDYALVASDDFVGPGDVLHVDALALGPDDRIMFDGTAETDGRFFFTGGGSNDFFFGGAGADSVEGGGGADALTGGGGNDIFVYRNAGDSSGASYDTLADFNPAADRIDLPGTVAGFAGAIEGGTLSYDTFNDDLALAVGNLGASQAVWFAPDQGDLAGQIFLIVDGNGQAGYQEGEDFVIAVGGSPLADLTGNTDIFI